MPLFGSDGRRDRKKKRDKAPPVALGISVQSNGSQRGRGGSGGALPRLQRESLDPTLSETEQGEAAEGGRLERGSALESHYSLQVDVVRQDSPLLYAVSAQGGRKSRVVRGKSLEKCDAVRH